jgi:hypothetical protein
MPRAKKLVDPVAGQVDLKAEEEEFDSLDVSKLKVEVLPEDAAKALKPFDGYPVKKIKIPVPKYVNDRQVKGSDGKTVIEPKQFCLTDWVLHNHLSDPIHQDPSNRKHRTFHSRSILDILKGNTAGNITMQFATPIETASGKFYGALVPDPYIRCQLIFAREKKSGRIIVDKRYMLLDPDQKNRLKQCYFSLIKPQLDMEAAADKITAGEEPATMREISPGEEL